MKLDYGWIKREIFSEEEKDIKTIYNPVLFVNDKKLIISNNGKDYKFDTKEEAFEFAKDVYNENKNYFEEVEVTKGFKFNGVVKFGKYIKNSLQYDIEMKKILNKLEEFLKNEFNCEFDVDYISDISGKEVCIVEKEEYDD